MARKNVRYSKNYALSVLNIIKVRNGILLGSKH